jgi:putative Mg2+ transporter-C (MgtC) family protein
MFVDPLSRFLGPTIFEITFTSIVLRILISVVLATVVGCERSAKRHSAGLRTFVLVSLGSTVAMLMDCFIARMTQNDRYLFSTAVIVAISIICVNSILFTSRSQIKGLTTSVALWTCSIIGLSSGAAFFTITIAAFTILMICLSWMPHLEVYLKNRSNHFEIHLELKSSQYLQEFVTTSRNLGLIIDEIELNPAYANSGLSVYSIALSIKSRELKQYKTHREIIEALGTLDYVYHIEEMRY